MSPSQDFPERLRDLSALPGATLACVVDAVGGTVVAAAGPLTTDPAAVGAAALTAARLVAAGAPGEESEPDHLDDLMVVSRHCYHLMRPVPGAAGEPLVVYVRLDRARSNLALARRALANAAPTDGGSNPTPPPPPAAMPAAVAIPRPRPQPRAADTEAGPHARPLAQQAPPAPVATATRPPPAAPREAAAAAAAAPTAEEAGPLPLPRRAARLPSRPRPRPPSVPDSSPSVLGQRWADDVGTLRRLLVGLRALGGQ